jgi:hypothetical protein
MRERVTPPEQAHDYLLEVSRAWESLAWTIHDFTGEKRKGALKD